VLNRHSQLCPKHLVPCLRTAARIAWKKCETYHPRLYSRVWHTPSSTGSAVYSCPDTCTLAATSESDSTAKSSCGHSVRHHGLDHYGCHVFGCFCRAFRNISSPITVTLGE